MAAALVAATILPLGYLHREEVGVWLVEFVEDTPPIDLFTYLDIAVILGVLTTRVA